MGQEQQDRIKAAVATAYEAEDTVNPQPENWAGRFIRTLGAGGFEIVPKVEVVAPGLDPVLDGIAAEIHATYDAGHDGHLCLGTEAAARIVRDIVRIGFEIVPKSPAGSAARVGEARRTGDWSGVSDADWTAWVNVLRRSDPAAAAEFLPTYETLARLHRIFVRADGTVAPLDKAALDAGVVGVVERDIEPAEDAPGYLKAVRLLRGALPSIREIDVALDGASPDGSEGNIWSLRQLIIDRRPAAGPFWGEPEASFEPAAEPKVKAGRVVVLDEAGERKLQDLLAGRSVPTGRLVEVTYRMPDGSTRTQRHAEFGKLDAVSYDPLLPAGAQVDGATVLSAEGTLKLEPGKACAAATGVFDRDVPPLGIFWSDGLISFVGDAAEMTAFRDMAAKVVGVPGSRDAA